MKKPRGQVKATSSLRSFVQKYRIGKGGDVNKIVSQQLNYMGNLCSSLL
jgi:hypothetical protein